jgi:hypothetical protein
MAVRVGCCERSALVGVGEGVMLDILWQRGMTTVVRQGDLLLTVRPRHG